MFLKIKLEWEEMVNKIKLFDPKIGKEEELTVKRIMKSGFWASGAGIENVKKFINVEHVHFYGCYLGNYPSLSSKKIMKLCKILNNV